MKHRLIHLSIAVLILIMAFGLRVHRLEEKNYHWDEGFSQWVTGKPLGEMLRTTADDTHPALYYLINRTLQAFAGDSVWSVRFSAVMLGMVSVAFAYALGTVAAGRWVGLLAMLLMAVSRANIDLSQFARMHIAGTAFATGGLWAAAWWLRDPRRWKPAIVYTLCLAAALFSYYLTFMLPVVFGVAFVGVWWSQGRPVGMLARWVAMHIAAALLLLPWLIYAIHDIAPSPAQDAQLTPPVFFAKFYFVILAIGIPADWGRYLPAVAVFTLLVLTGAVFIWKQRPERRAMLALLVSASLVPMGVIYFMIWPMPFKAGWPLADRYMPLMAAGFYALAAWGLVAFTRKSRLLGWGSGIFLVVVSLVGLPDYYASRLYRDNFDSSAATLYAHRQPGDAVVLHNDKQWPNWLAAYDESWTGTFYLSTMDAPAAASFILPIWRQADAVWLVNTPDSLVSDPGQHLSQWLETHAVATQMWDFNAHTLTVYARTPERAAQLYALAPNYPIPQNISGAVPGLTGISRPEKRYPVGDSVILALYWQTPPDDPVNIALTGNTLERIFTFDPPTAAPQGVTRQMVNIPLTPDMPSGDYHLSLEGVSLHRFELVANFTAASATEQDIANRLDWQLGESITLLGYALSDDSPRPGDTLAVTLYWRTQSALTERYKVLVYVLGPFNPETNNPLWGQYDGEPFNWQMPTTQWPPGVILADTYAVPLAQNIAPGAYDIGVVVYEWVGGARLPISAPDGTFLGDMATLAPVTVR